LRTATSHDPFAFPPERRANGPSAKAIALEELALT
jgi:hypothetical protein